MSQAEINELINQGQYYFLPYYVEIVDQHPFGIRATEVKEKARQMIITRHSFDPFDDTIAGANPSTHASSASQWANNLISNEVLEDYMLVARGGRAMLYPLSGEDNSRPTDQGTVGMHPPIGDELETLADARSPVVDTSMGGRYRRSAALAELVRQRAGYVCTVVTNQCVMFPGSSGPPYVEVHHIIPMSIQATTDYNLDRVANMAAVCVVCHTKLHKGSRRVAEDILNRLLQRYESSRGATLTSQLGDCDVPHNVEDLLDYYDVA